VPLDVDDVALGHATKLRWNTTDDWIWSREAVHEALVTREDFDCAQQLMGAGPWTASRTARDTTEIHNLVTAIGDLVGVLRTADPADKAAVYRHLGLKVTYEQEARTLQVRPDLLGMGFSSCPRIDTDRNPTAAAAVGHDLPWLTWWPTRPGIRSRIASGAERLRWRPRAGQGSWPIVRPTVCDTVGSRFLTTHGSWEKPTNASARR